MKAKKNLYEAPATEVTTIVMDAISKAYEWSIEDNGEFNEIFIPTSVLMVNGFSEWKLPTQLMIDYMYGRLNDKDIEEEIINEVLKDYHKSLAA